MEVFVVNEYVDKDVAGVEILVIPSIDTPAFTVKAHAKRDPIDKPNETVALLLAYGRAFEKIGKKLEKRGNGLVRHADNERDGKILSSSNQKKSLTDVAFTRIERPEATKRPIGGYKSTPGFRMTQSNAARIGLGR